MAPVSWITKFSQENEVLVSRLQLCSFDFELNTHGEKQEITARYVVGSNMLAVLADGAIPADPGTAQIPKAGLEFDRTLSVDHE